MKYALIIGNDQYADPKLSRLKTPTEDARELARVLKDKNIGGFDKVKSIINQTELQTRIVISAFLQGKKSDDLVLIYFSGHGVLDNQNRLHLALRNTKTNHLNATALPSSFVSDQLSQCKSKRQIFILDCCHSGAFAYGTKSGEHKAVTKSTFEGYGYGRVVLTASDSTQFALEGDQALGKTNFSLFTHFLLEGLKTGEADKDGDGFISLDEWYEYTHSKVVEATSKQVPQKWSYRQEGELLIANNPVLKKRLPKTLIPLLESPYSSVRIAAINELSNLLKSEDIDIIDLARQNLKKLNMDSDSTVSNAAKSALNLKKQPLVKKPSDALKRKDNKPRQFPKSDLSEKYKIVQEVSFFPSGNKLTFSNGMEFMRVPAGKFLMGSENANSSVEQPQHTVDIPYDYWMARYPLTNELYNAFAKAKGIKHPVDGWEKKKDHPVVYFKWTGAMAYCQWLNNLLTAELPLGLVLRLPTEAEWEKAARGTDGLEYPWGNQFDKNKCNTSEGGKGGTTSVGLYSPQGDSPYGCADMSGNVWEWTRSLRKAYPYNVKDGREDEKASDARVLRGGSFLNFGRVARCAYRRDSVFGYFDNGVGLRVVMASPFLS